MKSLLTWLTLFWVGSALGADWHVTQANAVSVYVLCHEGDCPARTVKVLDVPSPVIARETALPTTPIVVPSPISVRFDLASDRLIPAEKTRLKAFLERLPDAARFLVMGSTDQVGHKQFNAALATKRARAVAAFMRANGVQKGSIKVDARCCIEHPPSTNPGARRAVISIIE